MERLFIIGFSFSMWYKNFHKLASYAAHAYLTISGSTVLIHSVWLTVVTESNINQKDEHCAEFYWFEILLYHGKVLSHIIPGDLFLFVNLHPLQRYQHSHGR